MITSIKQVLRTKAKSIMLFATAVLVSVLLAISVQLFIFNNEQISSVENNFTTIVTVEQIPDKSEANTYWNAAQQEHITVKYTEEAVLNYYDEVIPIDVLDFHGAEIIGEIEKRPFYVTSLPQITDSDRRYTDHNVIEFTATENTVPNKPVLVKLERVLSGNMDERIGEIYICDHFTQFPNSLEKGKTYIAKISSSVNTHTDVTETTSEYTMEDLPWTDIYNTDKFEEVTEDFYETDSGKKWLNMIENQQVSFHSYPVLPTNNLELLPSFHSNTVNVVEGREITAEEFANGATVCLISTEFMFKHKIEIGDTISLPLYYADYAKSPQAVYHDFVPIYDRGNLDENGEIYDIFFEAEYEIVGAYNRQQTNGAKIGTIEIATDMFIIPSKSVTESDTTNIDVVGAMRATTTSFQIPNGSIAKYQEMFATVPESSKLELNFYDNGYEEIISNLNQTRLLSLILLCFGFATAIACITMYIYFYIVCEQKRIAIEQSLGKTKRECVFSMLFGMSILFAVSVVLGAVIGTLVFQTLNVTEITAESEYIFSTQFSTWERMREDYLEDFVLNKAMVNSFSLVIMPLTLIVSLVVTSVITTKKYLKIEPILILGRKD